MTRYRKQKSPLQDTLKDYFVPIIGGLLILLLIYRFFTGGEANEPIQTSSENRIPANIVFEQDNTAATIVYPGDTKEEVSNNASLYKGETLIVESGSVQLSMPDNNQVRLNRIAEFGYIADSNYSLSSSDAWLTLENATEITMSYARVSSPAGSILSLTQNEANSSIYVLRGSARVTNIGGASTMLTGGERISIARQNAADENADLGSQKGNIDSFFKSSDWFIENNGIQILQESIESENNQETQNENTQQGLLQFESLRDEMSVSAESISIAGSLLSEDISSLTFNNRQANIGSDRTFSLESLPLTQAMNDIVVKIYDNNRNILEKQVYTVYTDQRAATTSSNTQNSNSSQNASSARVFEVDATQFGFTEPSNTGKFSTNFGEVTIRGFTTAEGITKVEVNNFELSSFNGSTWRYHAFERFETLQDGTNQYRIDYYGTDGNIVYTDYYTIVKRDASESPASTNSETTQTDETAQETEVPPADTTSNSQIPEEGVLFSQ